MMRRDLDVQDVQELRTGRTGTSGCCTGCTGTELGATRTSAVKPSGEISPAIIEESVNPRADLNWNPSRLLEEIFSFVAVLKRFP